jgi:hypothetical protein
MICTEEEARKKWCPKYQVAQLFNDLISNRGGFGDDCRCIASSCMWWVETGRMCKKCNGTKNAQCGHWHADCEHEWQSKGYCGPGGKP